MPLVATPALSSTILPSSLSPDSQQKPVISWPRTAQQANPRQGQVIPRGSMQCNNQSSDIPLRSAGLCEDKGRHVSCAWEDKHHPPEWSELHGHAAPFHHVATKPGRTGKKTTGKSKILGLTRSSHASLAHRTTLYQAHSYLNSMKKIQFYTNPYLSIKTQPALL